VGVCLLLGRISALRMYIRPTVTDRAGWSVCRSVCLSVTVVSHAKRLNRSRRHLGCGTRVGLNLEACIRWDAMQPFFVKLAYFDHLLNIL